MILVGVTGSIAMGKSTITGFFEKYGAAVTNADVIVHQLYESNPQVIAEVKSLWPQAIEDGKVNRIKLGAAVFGNAEAVKKLENILHPKVEEAEKAFVAQAEKEGKELVVLDIPLLYEVGAEKRVHKVVVVSAPYEIQKKRALMRKGMTEEKFNHILSLQIPDVEKRARADFIVDTGKTFSHSEADVVRIIKTLKQEVASHA